MENETIKERFLGTIFGQAVGDADTNAAVAGAILGAKFGICHIPEEWKDGLLYASMLHDKVRDLYFYNHRHSRKVSLMTKNGNV